MILDIFLKIREIFVIFCYNILSVKKSPFTQSKQLNQNLTNGF
jgi:hypothetical protein